MSTEGMIAFASLILAMLTAVVVTTRRITGDIAQSKLEINKSSTEAKTAQTKEFKDELNKMHSAFGESVKAAMEQANLAHAKIDNQLVKIQQVELYIRDNYIEVETFKEAIKDLKHALDQIESKVDDLKRDVPARNRPVR